jgi:hypothetical protein
MVRQISKETECLAVFKNPMKKRIPRRGYIDSHGMERKSEVFIKFNFRRGEES